MSRLDDAIRQSWPVFYEAIRMRRTVTYTELAGRAGPPLHRRHLHRQLLIGLSYRCRAAGLPDLATLVVRQDSGLPGQGWWVGRPPTADPAGTWSDCLIECWNYPWKAGLDTRLIQPSRAE